MFTCVQKGQVEVTGRGAWGRLGILGTSRGNGVGVLKAATVLDAPAPGSAAASPPSSFLSLPHAGHSRPPCWTSAPRRTVHDSTGTHTQATSSRHHAPTLGHTSAGVGTWPWGLSTGWTVWSLLLK